MKRIVAALLLSGSLLAPVVAFAEEHHRYYDRDHATDARGNLYVVLREGNAVYRIDTETDRVFHFAGTGEKGYSGDGGPAKLARFNGPKGIACAPDNSVYIADTENHVIRRIDQNGTISTVLGNGQRGDGPDGDPAACKLSRPHGVFVSSDGKVYVADSESHKLRLLIPKSL